MVERIFLTGFPKSGWAELAESLEAHPRVERGAWLSGRDELQGLQPCDGASEELAATWRTEAPTFEARVPLEAAEHLLHKLPALHQVFPQAALVVAVRGILDTGLDLADDPGLFHRRPLPRVVRAMADPLDATCRAMLAMASEYQRLPWPLIIPVHFEHLASHPDTAIEGLCRTLGLGPGAIPVPKVAPAEAAASYDHRALARFLQG